MLSGIQAKTLKQDADGNYTHVKFRFGPHHLVELKQLPTGDVTFALKSTHHGFQADASELNGQLEQIINLVRAQRPENVID